MMSMLDIRGIVEPHADLSRYYVYMNYANKGGRKVAIVDPPEKKWEAKLEEPSVFNPAKAQTPAYHAMSASGNATATRKDESGYGIARWTCKVQSCFADTTAHSRT